MAEFLATVGHLRRWLRYSSWEGRLVVERQLTERTGGPRERRSSFLTEIVGGIIEDAFLLPLLLLLFFDLLSIPNVVHDF